MNNVLIAIEVIKMIAKSVHYRSSDECFYALHLLADKVDFGDSEDALKESYYLGMKEELPPTEKELAAGAVEHCPDTATLSNKDLIRTLYDVCSQGILSIEEAKREPGLIAGVHAILDSVSQSMLVIKGLSWRTINGETTATAV